ncbi:hypothetical protein [Phycisphaera mikurensis]|uniref:hypothetical protein n=1 Tax=Phycisphaera mikurensis TaxID=547188 RepID=UPI0012B594D0|nr:hypothetical protein [Phycisphaera mikurensis]MBB6440799.1 hypothetical protein [Phycisphaera mikurensis]
MAQILARNHLLSDAAHRYVTFVEGSSDIAYINVAASRFAERTGTDLLDAGNGTKLTFFSPARPSSNLVRRGGVEQLKKLADDLKVFALQLDAAGPICFLFDHDQAGCDGAREVRKMGYQTDARCVLTLDPKYHPRACRHARKGGDPVVIEDLLSLDLQRRFFAQGGSSCDVAYISGDISRFSWRHPSKDDLCRFAQAHASCEDLIEVARIIWRIRELWRLPVPEEARQLLEA